MATWIFQSDRDEFDVASYLGAVDTPEWTVQPEDLRSEMKAGDQAFIWRAAGHTRGKSGIIAECLILAEPSAHPTDAGSLPFWRVATPDMSMWVRLRVVRVANAKKIIRQEWLRNDPALADLPILRSTSETNFKVSAAQADRLNALWRNTGRDWDRAETIAGLWAYHRTFGGPVTMRPDAPVVQVAMRIGRATQGVYNKVMNFRALDPRDPRSGFSGGGGMAAMIWNEFFDPIANTIRGAQLEIEHNQMGTTMPLPRKSQLTVKPALSVITEGDRISGGYAQLKSRLCEGAESLGRRLIGFRGGQVPADVYYRSDLDLWMGFGEAASRYWTAYGFGVPGRPENASIIAEINPPREGIQRRIAGAFAQDAEGELYLIHRGKIGGGKQRISKSVFLPYYRLTAGALEAVSDGGQISEVIVLGALADEKLPAQIASFVHRVREFKYSTAAGYTPDTEGPTQTHVGNSFSPEFEGQKEYATRDRIAADCTHGTIVNSLQRLLTAHDCRTTNDRSRDLVIVDSMGRHRVLFEIKPSAMSYPVYQAVGQLLMHTVEHGDVRRVAVLPRSLSRDFRDRLTKLGIDVVTFEWVGQSVSFDGIERFFH